MSEDKTTANFLNNKYVIRQSKPNVPAQQDSKWTAGVANFSSGECFWIEETEPKQAGSNVKIALNGSDYARNGRC